MKDIENDTKQKDTPCSWIERINIVQMSIVSKEIYRVNAITMKLPMAFFHKTWTNNLDVICMETQNTLARTILRKTKKLGVSYSLTEDNATKLSNQNSMVLA